MIDVMTANNGNSVITIVNDTGNVVNIKLPPDLTQKQFNLLNFAFEVAKADGYKEPKYLQGIIMQETKAGQMADYRVSGLTNAESNRYFGVGQLKMVAAKTVMAKFPQMWSHLDTKTDEELKARLIVDDEFNVRVASKYALLMGINTDPSRAITAYNMGQTGATTVDPAQHDYTIKVKQHAARVKYIMSSVNGLQSDKPIQIATLGQRP